MKKYIVIISLGLMSISLCLAQEAPELYSDFNDQQNDSIIQFLDSTIVYQFSSHFDSVPYGKTVYTSNNLNQVIHSVSYEYIDSLFIWKTKARYQYEYDIYGNKTYSLLQNYNSDSLMWINGMRSYFSFDNNGNRILYEYWFWDTDVDEWYGFRKNIYAYDDLGNKTLEKSWKWDSYIKNWYNNALYEWEYCQFGYQIYTKWKWNRDLNKWEGQMSRQNFYSDNGDDTLSYSLLWEENHWKYLWKYENSFDESGNTVLTYMYNWNTDSTEWENMRKTTRSYTTFNKHLEIIDMDWDSNEFVNSRRYYRQYNNLEQEVSYEYQMWENELMQWGNYQLYESYYDIYGNLEEYIKWKWDNDIVDWTGDFRSINEYDAHSNKTLSMNLSWSSSISDWTGNYFIVYSFDENDFEYLRVNYGWNDSTNLWFLDNKEFFYYETNVGVDNSEFDGLSIYPNPTTDYLIVNCGNELIDRVTLTDLSGKIVQNNIKCTGIQTLDLKSLATGIYIINIQIGKENFSDKVIIK